MKTERFLWAAGVVVAVLWTICLVASLLNNAHIEQMGQLGDSFGWVSSLFGGLGFVGVALTLRHQERDRNADAVQRAKDREQEENRRVQDKKEEDERQAKLLEAEERVAKINALTAMVQVSGEAISRMVAKERELLQMRAFGFFHENVSGNALEWLMQIPGGLEYAELHTRNFGGAIRDGMDVSGLLNSGRQYADQEIIHYGRARVEHGTRLLQAMAEIERLSSIQLRRCLRKVKSWRPNLGCKSTPK